MPKRKKKEKSTSVEKKTTKTKESTNTYPFVCTVICLGILARLLVPFFNQTLSQDEVLLIGAINNREFWGLFNPLSFPQAVPPLFLCITKLFSLLIPANTPPQIVETVFKTVPLLASIGNIFAFHNLLKNIFINKFVILAGLILFAFNPMLITYSWVLKPFSTDVLVCTLLITYFIRYNPEGYWRQFIQILLLSCSIMVSLPSVLIILGGIVHILFKDWRKFFFAISAFALFLIFYFIYHLWGIMEAHGASIDTYWSNFFITKKNIYHWALNMIKTNFNDFITPIIGLSAIGLGFIASCFRDKKFAIILAVTLLAIISASYLHLYPFAPRLLLFLTPMMIILTCEICDLIPANNIISKILPIIFVGLTFYNLLTGFN